MIPMSTYGRYPRTLQQAFPSTIEYGAAISVPTKPKNRLVGRLKAFVAVYLIACVAFAAWFTYL